MLRCPSCSAAVTFTFTSTNLKECSCGRILFLESNDDLRVSTLEAAQKFNQLIVPGLRGDWGGKKFTITGRLFAITSEWVYNYWHVIFEDGNKGFLAQGYGSYAILTDSVSPALFTHQRIRSLNINDIVSFGAKHDFYLIRKTLSVQIQIEAEVSTPVIPGDPDFLDFYSANGDYISVIQFKEGFIRYYDTEFVTYQSLHFTAPIPKDTPRPYACINCSKSMSSIALPFTMTLSCKHCGSIHLVDAASGALKLRQSSNAIISSDITLGTKGAVDGIEFEVIGFTLKQENNAEQARWKEYTLYNREQGFSYLSEYEGHWIYVKENPLPPVIGNYGNHEFRYKNERFSLFNSYTYEVISSIGEQPYNVTSVTGYSISEYISPPSVMIREQNKNESNWFIGKHIPVKLIAKNFSFEEAAPRQYGIGMIEPKGTINRGRFLQVGLISILAMLLIHVGISFTKESRLILEGTYQFSDTSNTVSIVSPKFTVTKWRSNLEFKLHAPISNSWFELSGSLINADNGKEYSFEKGIEYYSGYSEGESWSEGSTADKAYLTEIPAGTYFLNMSGTRENAMSMNYSGCNLEVYYDVSTDRNLWFAIFAVVIIGAIQYYIFYTNDKKRWQNSQFSPYDYEH